MTTNNKTKRTSNPLIKTILSEASPLKRMQNKNRVALACRIDDLIKEKGYNNTQFANKLNKQPSVITKWLSGTHNFTMETLDEIAYFLGVETSYLIQPQTQKVIYVKTFEVIMPIIKSEHNYKKNDQNYIDSNLWYAGHTKGLPYTLLTAKC